MDATAAKLKVVCAITERGNRTYRTRIGIAWQNADGSLSARLDAFPVSGQIRVLDWSPADADEPGAQRRADEAP